MDLDLTSSPSTSNLSPEDRTKFLLVVLACVGLITGQLLLPLIL